MQIAPVSLEAFLTQYAARRASFWDIRNLMGLDLLLQSNRYYYPRYVRYPINQRHIWYHQLQLNIVEYKKKKKYKKYASLIIFIDTLVKNYLYGLVFARKFLNSIMRPPGINFQSEIISIFMRNLRNSIFC